MKRLWSPSARVACLVLFSSLILTVFHLSGAAASDPSSIPPDPHILFILDGSGSMWAKIGDEEKITIAKDVMTDLISTLPENVKIGLEVYGHRKKGDCNDIEVLVPVGKAGRDEIVRIIRSIQPKGMTPITTSLEVAAEHLKDMEADTTIILVSDGKETCEGDPCARIQALKETGLRLTAHVIGFDIKSEEKEQLACIAEQGGGRYFSADNADQLKDALSEVIEQASSGAFLGALIKDRQGNPTPGYVQIFQKEGDRDLFVTHGACGEKPGVFRVAPGTYKMIVKDKKSGDVITFEDILVEDGQEVIREASFSSRLGGMITGFNDEPVQGFIQVHRIENGKARLVTNAACFKEPKVFNVTPGIYRLVLKSKPSGQQVVFDNLPLEGGQEVIRTVSMSARLGGIIRGFGGTPLQGYLQIHRIEDGKARMVTNTSCYKKPEVFDVIPGVYRLVLRSKKSGQSIVFDNIPLAKGEEVIKEALLSARLGGVIKDSAGNPQAGYIVVSQKINGKPRNIINARCGKGPEVFDITPGVYKLVLTNQKTREQKVFENITLEEGQEVIKEAVF